MSLIKNILCLLLFFNFSVFAFTPYELNKSNDFEKFRVIQEFKYHATSSYLQLDQKDLDLIDEYISMNQSLTDENFEKVRGTGYLFQAIFSALETNKLPISYIEKIRKLAITVNFYDKQKMKDIIGHVFVKDLKNLMWLIELRTIKDPGEFHDFLYQSLNPKSDNKFILKVLIQNNLYHDIQNWFSAKDIKQYGLLIELLKRRSKLVYSIKNNIEPERLIQAEYTQFIDEVFESLKTDPYQNQQLLYRHNDWLLKLMNTNKDMPGIKNLLLELNKDWLVYNNNALNTITGSDKEDKFRRVSGRLNIMWKTEEILFNKISLFGPDYGHNKKSRKLINEKLKIINGAKK